MYTTSLLALAAKANFIPIMSALYSASLFDAKNWNLMANLNWSPCGLSIKTPTPFLPDVEDPSTWTIQARVELSACWFPFPLWNLLGLWLKLQGVAGTQFHTLLIPWPIWSSFLMTLGWKYFFQWVVCQCDYFVRQEIRHIFLLAINKAKDNFSILVTQA